jgi:hypothetical protein
LGKQKRPERDRRRSTVEINLLGETKARTRQTARARGCLGLGSVFVLTVAGPLVAWTVLH